MNDDECCNMAGGDVCCHSTRLRGLELRNNFKKQGLNFSRKMLKYSNRLESYSDRQLN